MTIHCRRSLADSAGLWTRVRHAILVCVETKQYAVEGMTCAHCVAAVTAEVERLPGIASVSVDLNEGSLTVTGDSIDDGAIAAAVEEAGYSVT